VYINICIYIHTLIHACRYTNANICIYTLISSEVHIPHRSNGYLYVYIYIYIYIYIYMHIYMCIYICVYIYPYIYIHIYTYIYTDITKYIYIHIYVPTVIKRGRGAVDTTPLKIIHTPISLSILLGSLKSQGTHRLG
jgi:hypothetical protein